MRQARKIFLSHASADRRLATRLAAALQAAGFDVWYSPTALRGSQKWHAEIGKALTQCDWFVLLASPAACRKPARKKPWWIQREVVFALNGNRYEERLTPVLCKGAKVKSLERLSWYLPQIQCVSLQPDFSAGCRALLATLSGRRKR